jgi:hypothetical protein
LGQALLLQPAIVNLDEVRSQVRHMRKRGLLACIARNAQLDRLFRAVQAPAAQSAVVTVT